MSDECEDKIKALETKLEDEKDKEVDEISSSCKT
jgi:hypothetical protein